MEELGWLLVMRLHMGLMTKVGPKYISKIKKI